MSDASAREPVARGTLREADHARTARNSAVSLAAQAIRFALYFGTAILLARRLSPADFGLFGIALALTSFLEIAKDGGLVVPVIQTKTLTPDQLSSLFWVNAATGTLLTLISVVVAPLAARLYEEPRLLEVIRVLALTFLVGGLSTQHRALLRRENRFTALAICETSALAAGAITASLLALRGYGYWSLVWLYITMELVQTVLTVTVSGWRPGWPRPGVSVRPLLRFGGLMMAFEMLGYLNLKFDNLVVAWYLGPAALGYYDKAYQFLLLPVNQIGLPVSAVAHSTLSRAQNDPEHYRHLFDQFLLVTTGLGMPLTAFLFGNVHLIVETVLGAQWLPSVPIFRALAPAAFLMTTTACVGWIFLSLGRAGRQLKWSAFTSAVTVVAYFGGVRWGTAGVAACFAVSRCALFVPTLRYTCEGSPVRWTRILQVAARPALASVLALGLQMVTDSPPGNDIWHLIRNFVLFAIFYVAGWIFVPGGTAFLRRHLPSGKMPVGK